MLKDKKLTECSREKYIDAQRKDREQQGKFRKAQKPNDKTKLH